MSPSAATPRPPEPPKPPEQRNPGDKSGVASTPPDQREGGSDRPPGEGVKSEGLKPEDNTAGIASPGKPAQRQFPVEDPNTERRG